MQSNDKIEFENIKEIKACLESVKKEVESLEMLISLNKNGVLSQEQIQSSYLKPLESIYKVVRKKLKVAKVLLLDSDEEVIDPQDCF